MAEKSLNDLPRELRMLFNKGNDALLRENFDYAIDLFGQVLKREPLIFECRKALRRAQMGKAGSGGGFFKKILSSAGSSPQRRRGATTPSTTAPMISSTTISPPMPSTASAVARLAPSTLPSDGSTRATAATDASA